ncbi:hypothetical protein A2348_02515 [Candidatus Uhrbacteria bacterium RIFOXYB12_FULL_58_10]|uniref:M23ase beta-sheet core domain-containing protein n=1 Tax=Candidatus Uhrbacteria bacterium RIFOXYB2_FULL_57_15 TaxID=1802422 RepID=A0A1F7W7M3_9BACT|nr:MAG: hypothetical protein A2348_02515 [Candidatus Uhrbacteria bacterium RIFOXYB12_FULL_58_10]OGL98197.1 MAG: hypothetical protein A2304_03745 [Candidatus Uhrbacteria bacterium RIFOXYB2_FULL_57_15]OGL99171.1 MAG: hypothetical protein A2501_03160 [Candidatus Uhrbacteria bacterium RIFOXYC12_FULL_57_11]
MIHPKGYLIGFVILIASAACFGFVYAMGDNTPNDVVIEDAGAVVVIDSLNEQISEKRSDVEKLNQNIDKYREKISLLQSKETTIEVELELLDNRIAKTELDIDVTEKEMSALNDEILVLETQMEAVEAQLSRSRESLAQLLRQMDVYDNDLTLQLLFGSDSFGDLFTRLQELSSVTGDLKSALDQAEAERVRFESDRASQIGKRKQLADLQTQQETQMALLEDEQGSKGILLAQTQRSEAQFQSFLSELRGEQQYVNQQIALLQDEVERKLSSVDSVGEGSSVLSWPVEPLKGISALFHDKSYPFRHLFEHPGIDLPVPLGTPVLSAAPGYVAWTRTGNMYGNYVMVIHSNGIATLYAHLSKVSVSQDQFVSRGSTLGLSGGVPGTPGAGLSTGAHLHFEVRLNGIPTDPLNYLVER